MSFSIGHYKENGLSLIGLQDTATNTKIAILPAFGAILHAFEIPVQNAAWNVIDNYPSLQAVESGLATSFKSSKLSPFVCRMDAGKYELDDEVMEFTNKFQDGSAIHGLLYNKAFNTVHEFADDHKATVSLRYHYKKEDPGYPFDYVCEVRYTLLHHQTLQVETTVLNLEELSIPVADGWHPYFQLGAPIDDCTLQFASDMMLEFDEKLIPTGRLIREPAFMEPVLLEKRFLDNCFLLQVQEGVPCCMFRNPANKLSVSFFTNSYYPYLQIYTPDHRNSIAIENLSAAPDSFNNGMGVMLLPPRQSHTFTVWYQVQVEK